MVLLKAVLLPPLCKQIRAAISMQTCLEKLTCKETIYNLFAKIKQKLGTMGHLLHTVRFYRKYDHFCPVFRDEIDESFLRFLTAICFAIAVLGVTPVGAIFAISWLLDRKVALFILIAEHCCHYWALFSMLRFVVIAEIVCILVLSNVQILRKVQFESRF